MKEIIVSLMREVLKKKNLKLSDDEILNNIEIPPSSDMGDYSFPCFFLSRQLRLSPDEIALELREKVGSGFSQEQFEDIQTNGGYINFFLNRKELSKNLITEILKKKESFGKRNIGKSQKALVEHTSINPNASPHIGRARNAIIGDSLVKILSFLNFRPEVHYYVNDVSKQIAMLVLAKAENLKFEGILKKYIEISKKVESSKKLEGEVFRLLVKFEQGDQEIIKKFNQVTKTCVEGQKKILFELGIKYNVFDYESNYISNSKLILARLEKTKNLKKDKEGRFYLNLKSTPVEKKMKSPVLVLTRSDGTGLYPLRDIAYTIDKIKISNKNIIVLGEDQKLYFMQIKEALKLLEIEPPEVIHYSFVLLSEKGKSKKMSTRKGDVVLLEDFLKEAFQKAKIGISEKKLKTNYKKIGAAAVKYSILKNDPNKLILFDLESALKFEGDTGPYLLYSYARAKSILRKSKNKESNFQVNDLEKNELELVKNLSQFPEVILNSYNNLNPSLIANYSHKLCQSFNEFYHSSKVIGSEKEIFRLLLVESFSYVLKNSLNLLGIEVIERM